LPQPTLGFGGRAASPKAAASFVGLASPGPEVSGALESNDADMLPEPPVRLPELPEPLPEAICPALPEMACPVPPDIGCPPLPGAFDPLAPPVDAVAPVEPLVTAGDEESEHAAPTTNAMPRRTKRRMLRMKGTPNITKP
jgi:hypothetical protein